MSLTRAALRRAVRVGAERLELGVDLAVDLGRSLDVREVVGRLLERSLDAVGAERAALVRVEGSETVAEDARDRLRVPDLMGYRPPSGPQTRRGGALSAREAVVGRPVPRCRGLLREGGGGSRGARPSGWERAPGAPGGKGGGAGPGGRGPAVGPPPRLGGAAGAPGAVGVERGRRGCRGTSSGPG